MTLEGDLAIDCEAMGLNYHRDRLCLLQLSNGNGEAYLVNFIADNYAAPNLKKLLSDHSKIKIFHFARFDVAIIKKYLDINLNNIYCTKIASKIARTYTDSHSLKDLCREFLGINISKQQQSSDWGGELNQEQINYSAIDVLYLHEIKLKLDLMLQRENRLNLAYECFKFINTRIQLDLMGWNNIDIFAHS